jgi:uncharacterized membrane protein YcaP (DUF421 family)
MGQWMMNPVERRKKRVIARNRCFYNMEGQKLFFNDWEGIWHILVTAVLLYPLLIIMLRISGKRTLSKMNMFDFVITIALGSMVSAIVMDGAIPLVEGLAGLAALIALQFTVTWSSVRFSFVNKSVKGEPQLLYHDGRFIEKAMKKERIKKDEIMQAVRTTGKSSFASVQAVVLETDGSLSVMEKESSEGESTIPAE